MLYVACKFTYLKSGNLKGKPYIWQIDDESKFKDLEVNDLILVPVEKKNKKQIRKVVVVEIIESDTPPFDSPRTAIKKIGKYKGPNKKNVVKTNENTPETKENKDIQKNNNTKIVEKKEKYKEVNKVVITDNKEIEKKNNPKTIKSEKSKKDKAKPKSVAPEQELEILTKAWQSGEGKIPKNSFYIENNETIPLLLLLEIFDQRKILKILIAGKDTITFAKNKKEVKIEF